MEGLHPVLLETLSNTLKPFGDCDQFTVGRAHSCSLDIPSSVISRRQCVFKKITSTQWALYDQSTYRSTLVNGKQIEGEFVVLNDSDRISFSHYSVTEYIFYSSPKNVPTKKRKSDEAIFVEDSSFDNSSIIQLSPSKPKVKKDNFGDVEDSSFDNSSIIQLSPSKPKVKKDNFGDFENNNELPENLNNSLIVFEAENNLLRDELKNKEDETEKLKLEIKDLKEKLAKCELEQERLIQDFKEITNSSIKNKSEDREVIPCGKATEVIVTFKDGPKKEVDYKFFTDDDFEPPWPDIDFEQLEIDTEVPNRCELDDESGDYCIVEEDLIDIFQSVDEVFFKRKIQKLRQVVEEKNLELSEQISAKEAYHMKVIETLEQELHCGVCSDLLYQPVALNCKHTFCSVCITEWKKKKKECPVCRAKIKSEVLPLVIDSFIDKAAELLGGDFKVRRDELKSERTARSAKPTPSRKKRGRQSTRGRRQIGTLSSFDFVSSRDVISLPVVTIDITGANVSNVRGVVDLTSPRSRRSSAIQSIDCLL